MATTVTRDERLAFDLQPGLLTAEFTVRCRRCGIEGRTFFHPLMRRRSRDARIAAILRAADDHTCRAEIPVGYSSTFDGKGLFGSAKPEPAT